MCALSRKGRGQNPRAPNCDDFRLGGQAPNHSGCSVSATTLQANVSTQIVHNSSARYLSSVIDTAKQSPCQTGRCGSRSKFSRQFCGQPGIGVSHVYVSPAKGMDIPPVLQESTSAASKTNIFAPLPMAPSD